ncbi:MAG: flagellin [Pseudomonadota bacterium]
MTSINTNSSALVALETLRGINSQLSTLNDQISTGKRVNNARDNASVFSIATTIEADVSSLKTLTDSLALGSSTVGLARSAAESIVDILEDTQSKIVQAQQSNVDRAKIQDDIDANVAQIQSIVEAASFNGLNLVDNGDSYSFLSSLNRTSSDVTTSSISVQGQNLSTTAATAGTTAVVVGDLKGTFLSTSGATTHADGTGVSTATATATANSETVTFAGQIIETGDTFAYTLEVGGQAVTASYVAAEGDTSNEVVSNLASQLQAGLTSNSITDVDITFSTSSRPSDNNVTLTIANNTGSTFSSASTFESDTGGVAGGLLAGLAGIDVETSDSTAAAGLGLIDNLLQNALDSAAAFGSAQNRFDTQTTFIQSLVDNLELGVSALVDADLTAASAELQSLQVQQQLGLQSLTIANQQPQTILSLFR